MTSSAPLPNVSDSIGFRAEYEKLVQEREELFQERLRLFGLKPTVYVRNLDPTTTESELKQWFQQSGAIKAVRLLLDNNGASTCTAFIEFYYIQSCEDACKRFNEQYRDKNSAQPLQVQLERKFQTAYQAYKGQQYRMAHHNPQSFDQLKMPSGGQQRSGNNVNQPNQIYMSPFQQGNYQQAPPHHHQPQHYRPNNTNGVNNTSTTTNNNGTSSSTTQGSTPPNENIIVAPNGDTNALYVANIRSDVSVDQLKAAFQEFGMIVDAKVIGEKGFGFVFFADVPSAKLALALNGQPNTSISKSNSNLLVQFKGQLTTKRSPE